jgi:hypothetical protein
VALLPAPAKLGRRYSEENPPFPGADVEGRSVDVSESDSESMLTASSGSSSISRASEACAIGEKSGRERENALLVALVTRSSVLKCRGGVDMTTVLCSDKSWYYGGVGRVLLVTYLTLVNCG